MHRLLVSAARLVRAPLLGCLLQTVLLCAFGTVLSQNAVAADYKVGIVLDKGGRDDKSFNSSAFKGAQAAEKQLGIHVKVLEGRDDNSVEPMLRALAEKKFDLIIAVGFSQKDAIVKVAKQFPQQHFVLIDSDAKEPNVESVLFEEHQGAYLVGALAAMKSKTGTIGFVGGMDIPLIRRFVTGFEAGIKAINPKAKLIVNYVGVTGDAWNNPPKGKELALAQYGQGADIVFAAAGATSMGVLDAAEEKKQLAIGVDSNQNWVKPGYILTSLEKRIDVVVQQVIVDGSKGVFNHGLKRYGLPDRGIDLSMDQYNKDLVTPAMLAKLGQLKADIISGKIKVPDYYVLSRGP